MLERYSGVAGRSEDKPRLESVASGLERSVLMEMKLEEDKDEFRSCCAGEEELDRKEMMKQGLKNGIFDDYLDEFLVRMFFKGASISEYGNSDFDVSGIGVVLEEFTKFL
ncbi:probable E3 ubiquitin-protein ligase ARI11 [Tanacetum coccineum]